MLERRKWQTASAPLRKENQTEETNGCRYVKQKRSQESNTEDESRIDKRRKSKHTLAGDVEDSHFRTSRRR